MPESKGNFWKSPLTRSRIKSDDVKLPEMLLGYFIPNGASPPTRTKKTAEPLSHCL